MTKQQAYVYNTIPSIFAKPKLWSQLKTSAPGKGDGVVSSSLRTRRRAGSREF
jgi:hypothetical protein